MLSYRLRFQHAVCYNSEITGQPRAKGGCELSGFKDAILKIWTNIIQTKSNPTVIYWARWAQSMGTISDFFCSYLKGYQRQLFETAKLTRPFSSRLTKSHSYCVRCICTLSFPSKISGKLLVGELKDRGWSGSKPRIIGNLKKRERCVPHPQVHNPQYMRTIVCPVAESALLNRCRMKPIERGNRERSRECEWRGVPVCGQPAGTSGRIMRFWTASPRFAG